MQRRMVRAMSTAVEVLHGEIYAAPEAKEIYAAAGLKGGWMGYISSRAAPLGAVPAEIVVAAFYNFHERLIRRSIPDAWTFATPDRIISARSDLARIAIERALDGADPTLVAEAADIAERAARAAKPEGRPLHAANAALAWPDDPAMRLWHACTLLREHRADGHNAILLAEGIDGCECHLLAVAAGHVRDEAEQREHRGYTEGEWEGARDRLRARGSLDIDGGFTPDGRALKQRIEDLTDDAAAQPFAEIGAPACERFLALAPAIAGKVAHLMPGVDA